jgi:hypothetical protein
MLFFDDWLDAYQEYPYQLPLIGKDGFVRIDTVTGEMSNAIKCPTFRHEGSYSTSIGVRVSGNRLYVSGNPSRYDRLDNLFGFTSVDECFRVFNHVLLSLGLPPFTKCTKLWLAVAEDEDSPHRQVSDGALITRLDITSNRTVGQGNELAYLRALSGLRYRNGIGRLHTNGATVDWLSSKGNASLIYPSAYNKGHEIALHSLPTIRRLYGEGSPEFQYLANLLEYCRTHGVIRFEQKLKSAFLRRNRLQFWGLSDHSVLNPLHSDFLSLDQKLQVTAMSLEHISDRLLRLHVVNSTHAANVTAMYALRWMHGADFDLAKSQVKTHRSRLRKIGIDIANPCNLETFSPVFVRELRTIDVSTLTAPKWYRHATAPVYLKAA